MMKFTLLLICLLSFTSCFIQKQQVISPYIKLKIFDSKTKEPISNATLFRADKNNDIIPSIKLGIVSNKGGIMVIPKFKIPILKGSILPFKLLSGKYIVSKKGYQHFVLDTHKSFDINEYSNMNIRHKSKIFLIKEK